MNHDLVFSDTRGSGNLGSPPKLGIHRLERVGDCFNIQGLHTQAVSVPPGQLGCLRDQLI